MALTVSGLSSGIDYNALIDQLIEVEKYKYNKMGSQKSELERKQTAYSDLATKVEALESAAQALKYSTDFGDKAATVADETYFTATASSTATTGNYSITVQRLASLHKFISGNGVTSETDTIASGAGSFVFKVGDSGDEQTVAVDATTTLEDLKDAINDLDAGVNAVILNTGEDTEPYRLVLSTTATGEDNKIIVTQDDTDLGFDVNDTTLSSANHLQTPQDAWVTVDGLDIYRESNTIADLIPGVTLSLHEADTGETTTLEIARDEEAVQTKISDLIEAYNDVVMHINNRSGYDIEENEADPLWGEGTVRSIRRRMSSIASGGVDGLPDEMKILAQIGVSTQRDGTLELDTGELQSALDESFEDVVNLFVDGESTDGVAKLFYDMAHEVTASGDGDIAIRKDGIADQIRKLTTDMEEEDARLERYEVRLIAEFSALEKTLAAMQSQTQFFTMGTT